MLRLLLFVLLPSFLISSSSSIEKFKQIHEVQDQVYSCDNTTTNNAYIYCYGKLLEAVNFLQLYNDSKTFVDMPMVNDPDVTIASFNKAFPEDIDKINATKLQSWIDENFSPAGTELDICTPSDWQANPPKLMNIVDPDLRAWALQLNNIWKVLCRKMNDKVKTDLDKYSIIFVPYEFIVPGGRFREYYYWDAYWIMKGLLVSDMHESVKSMIMNLGNMVDKYGFVPNGGRVYYTKRSQPPFLSGMVYDYYQATLDKNFVITMLPTLEKEFKFWTDNRKFEVTANGKTYNVFHYNSPTNMPRAESFGVDVRKAPANVSTAQLETYYKHVASGAESGWDFSSRWFADKHTFQDIETTNIAPIDLNSIICWNMDIMEFLYEQIGNLTEANKYRGRRADFRDTVTSVFYNATDGTWYDFNSRTSMHNLGFYPAMAAPLFTNCYNTLDQVKSEKLYAFMKNNKVFDYPSGIPTSMVNSSSEQWDFPNGWSPLNHMVIEGLRKSQNPQMQDQAFNIAQKWVMGNYRVYQETGHMYEKYNVIGTYPQPGSGGEYNVQDGFGWTNGAILDLLYTYGDRMKNTQVQTTEKSGQTYSTIFTFCLLIFTCLM